MGWKTVRAQVISALKNGTFQHETRQNIDTKNLLQMGRITPDAVRALLEKARGTNYKCSSHHQVPGVIVHIVTVDGWYIKFYLIDPDAIFISVH